MMEFELGEFVEGYPWEILENQEFELGGGVQMCKHCYGLHEVTEHFIGPPLTYQKFKVPVVVQAWNEGHNNATSVCLACILEAAFPGASDVAKAILRADEIVERSECRTWTVDNGIITRRFVDGVLDGVWGK